MKTVAKPAKIMRRGKFNKDLIYHRRVELGLSIEAVAKRLKMWKSNVAAWEEGRYLPTAPTIAKLAKALEVQADYFFD